MIKIQSTCNHNDTKKIPGHVTDGLFVIVEYTHFVKLEKIAMRISWYP